VQVGVDRVAGCAVVPNAVWTAFVATATRVGSYAALTVNSRQMEAKSGSVTLRTRHSRRALATNARHDGVCLNRNGSVARRHTERPAQGRTGRSTRR